MCDMNCRKEISNNLINTILLKNVTESMPGKPPKRLKSKRSRSFFYLTGFLVYTSKV